MIRTPKNSNCYPILGVQIDISNYTKAVNQIIAWASIRQSKKIFVANVHMIMEAWDSADFRDVLNSADMVVSDGMPLVVALRALGNKAAHRVRGPELMILLCKEAEKRGLVVGFYGGSELTQAKLLQFVNSKFPDLKVFAPSPPPFRPLTEEENDTYVKFFNVNGVHLLFVGLGCPKQEIWIHKNHDSIKSVKIGVGAAFDLYSGKTKSAPVWMQNSSLEWLYRLIHEPKRLWWRYLKHNPRFVVYFIYQYLLHTIGMQRFNTNNKP